MTNREKRTIAGPLLEVDIYPVWDDGRRIPERAPKTKPTTEAQRKYNEEQARRIEKNFRKNAEGYYQRIVGLLTE